MNLTQLANIGEFIGGVAVLVTLVYLAIQVRLSTEIQKDAANMAKADAVLNAVRTWSTYRQMIADDDLSDIWLKAQTNEALSPKENIRFRAILMELTYASLAAFEVHHAVGDQRGEKSAAQAVALELGNSKFMVEAWSEMARDLKIYGLGEFASEVTKRLEERR